MNSREGQVRRSAEEKGLWAQTSRVADADQRAELQQPRCRTQAPIW